MPTTRERLETLLRTFSGVPADFVFTDDTRFRGDLELDSLDLIELSLKIDDKFDIEMTDDEVDDLNHGTLGGMVAFIDRKRPIASSADVIALGDDPAIAAAINDEGGGRHA